MDHLKFAIFGRFGENGLWVICQILAICGDSVSQIMSRRKNSKIFMSIFCASCGTISEWNNICFRVFGAKVQNGKIGSQFSKFYYLLFGCPTANFKPLLGKQSPHPMKVTRSLVTKLVTKSWLCTLSSLKKEPSDSIATLKPLGHSSRMNGYL